VSDIHILGKITRVDAFWVGDSIPLGYVATADLDWRQKGIGFMPGRQAVARRLKNEKLSMFDTVMAIGVMLQSNAAFVRRPVLPPRADEMIWPGM